MSPPRASRVETVDSLHFAWILYQKNFIDTCDHCIKVEDINICGQLVVGDCHPLEGPLCYKFEIVRL